MIEFNPLVSIIVPVYNGANYLKEAIDSAIAQSYKNIEIIVVNDGSDDNGNTKAIALSYGSQIRYFEKENGGVATALNLGIREMKGEYFTWLSHDDVYYPDKIAAQIQCLINHNNAGAIVYSQWDIINKRSKLTGSVNFQKHSEENLFKPLYPLLNGLIHGCSLLIPRKYFFEVGLFKENLKTTQDYDLWFDFFRIAPVIFCKKNLIKSRVHDKQTAKTVGHHIEENNLWIGFMERVSENDLSNLSLTKLEFFVGVNRFLASTPYVDAFNYSKRVIDALGEDRIAADKNLRSKTDNKLWLVRKFTTWKALRKIVKI